MTEQRTSEPQTGLDRSFAALRGLGVRRRTDDKWIAGVSSGLADRLGIDPVIVRAAVVLLTLVWGIGITLYLVAWVLLPNDRNQIVAERALRDSHGGSIVLVVLAAFALFGGSWWGSDSGWGFPWGLALTGLLVWWLVKRSSNPDADQRVRAQQVGTPVSYGPSTTPPWPGAASGPGYPAGPVNPTPARPVVSKKPRRRSGGPLMALLAIGLTMATYGSLIWAGNAFSWTGDHSTIAIAGSLAALGLLIVVLGLAGWRAGFLTFLAVVLAVSAWTSSVIPSGVQVGGRVGDAVWTPTSVAPGTNHLNYRLGAGSGVLDLSGLPTEAAAATPTPTIPAYVGVGEMKVIVPPGLTVKVVGHVSLGEILLPTDVRSNGQGGSDLSRSIVIGDGPTDVLVDAGIGIGQLTVVKE